VKLPVVANGEVWTVEDARRCLAESGCAALMLGRGIVADPGLAMAVRGAAGVAGWSELLPLVERYWALIARRVSPRHRAGRVKQWLNLLRRRFPEAQEAFDRVRTVNDPTAVQAMLFGGAAGDAQRVRAAEETAAAPCVRDVATPAPARHSWLHAPRPDVPAPPATATAAAPVAIA